MLTAAGEYGRKRQSVRLGGLDTDSAVHEKCVRQAPVCHFVKHSLSSPSVLFWSPLLNCCCRPEPLQLMHLSCPFLLSLVKLSWAVGCLTASSAAFCRRAPVHVPPSRLAFCSSCLATLSYHLALAQQCSSLHNLAEVSKPPVYTSSFPASASFLLPCKHARPHTYTPSLV